MKKTTGDLARQSMLQQLYLEESIRSEGSSGIKQVRAYEGGTRPYHFTSYSAHDAGALHEHSSYDRTNGLGELVVVLNGVEFRTRHNDYKIRQPSTTSKAYDALEDIPFPPVPPSVQNKQNVSDQVTEMREYFKAFHTDNVHHRDFRPFFKPVMCYLEGAWTTDTGILTEPFQSDRHSLAASSWSDLQEKVQLTSASGGKDEMENFAYLPTTIVEVTADGEPVYAQWNYRIACHPIKASLSPKNLRPIDDIAVRMYNNLDMRNFARNKAARFSINPFENADLDLFSQSDEYNDTYFANSLLDDIMYEIPGKDNYPGHIIDDTFGKRKYEMKQNSRTELNTARYHRHFKTVSTGGTGIVNHNRGFSDPYLFVAETTNPKIAKMGMRDCQLDNGKEVCHTYEGRYSYAIPLEIVWLTPLQTWNPYDIHFSTNLRDPLANRRNGQHTISRAFNGSSSISYYNTPAEFFHGGEPQKDNADTGRNIATVLDSHGNVCMS